MIFCSSAFDKAMFCLGEIKGMLANDRCSSWYSRVGDLLMSVWDKKRKYGMVVDQPVLSVGSPSLHSVRPMAP